MRRHPLSNLPVGRTSRRHPRTLSRHPRTLSRHPRTLSLSKGRLLRSRLIGSLALIAGLSLIVGAGALPTAAAKPKHPVITVTDDRYVTVDGRPVGEIPAALIGANHRWPDDGKGMWDPETDTAVGGMDDLARRTGLAMVRYPGGTVANLFDFSRAVGPQQDRGCQTSGGFANGLFEPTDSRYGPDEQQKFVDSIGAETMIMVPTINRTAADAADFVEYMNAAADGDASNPNGGVDWAERRAANGHPEPYAITVWEYGNEPYLPNQRYWRSTDPEQKVKQFIEGGWQRQTADSDPYTDNDGLFSGCDLLRRQTGSGAPDQSYQVRFPPIGLPGDETDGVGDGPIRPPVLRVDGREWRLVDDLSSAGPDEQVYAITQRTGEVHFGDGVHGAMPPAGASLSIEYTSGPHGGLLDHQRAMKDVDPTISVCAGWGKSEFIAEMGDRPYDCLGVHSYTTPPDDGTPLRYHNLQRGAQRPNDDLARYRRELADHFPDRDDRPELIVTEYGVLNVGIRNYGATLAHVLYSADLVAGQLENDVRLATTSNLNGRGPADPSNRTYGELFGVSPTFVDTGRARMLSLYGGLAGGVTVRSEVTGNPVLEAETGSYGALRAVAACRGDTTFLMVINRDPEQTVRAELRLPRITDGRLRSDLLTGPDVGSYNTDADPDAVSVEHRDVPAPRGRIDHDFAPHSITRFELTTAKIDCAA